MKAVAYLKPGLGYIDYPEPEPPATKDWVKIKIAYAGICGTDAHILAGHFDPLVPFAPLPVGHESSGTIVAMGPRARAKGLKVGDKVTYYFNLHCGKCHFCRNGQENLCTRMQFNMSSMTEYIIVSEEQVYKLPDSISLLQGCLTEPVSFCLRTVDQGHVTTGSTVIIIGGGPIGLMTLQIAKLAGGSNITLVDPMASKRELALQLGAHHVIDPTTENVVQKVKEISKGRGFDAVFECSGHPSTIQQSMDVASAGAYVVYVAMYGDGCASVNLWDLFQRELHITAPHQSPYTWERAINVLPDLNLDVFTKCIYPMEDCIAAFDMQKTATQTKVIIKIDKDID